MFRSPWFIVVKRYNGMRNYAWMFIHQFHYMIPHSYETRYRAEDPWDVPDSQVPLLLTQVFPWGRKHGFSTLKTYTDRKMVGGDLYLNQLVAGKHESDIGTPMPQVTVMATKNQVSQACIVHLWCQHLQHQFCHHQFHLQRSSGHPWFPSSNQAFHLWYQSSGGRMIY